MKKSYFLFLTFCVGLILIFNACEKAEESAKDDIMACCFESNEIQMRMALKEDGYIELEVEPIVKIDCYFEDWNKTIMTPVSGLFEYYDQDNNWVASLHFGEGNCDQWVTKTWDINVFPDYPEGSEEFSLFQ